MLKKLKRKFVWINMSLVGVVLLIVFAVFCANTYRQEKVEVDRALEMALRAETGAMVVPLEIGAPESGGANGENRPTPGQEPFETRPFAYSAVTAYVTERGQGTYEVALIDSRNVSMSEAALQTAVESAFAQGKEAGRVAELELFYRKAGAGDRTKVAFVDSTYFDGIVRQNLLIAVVLFIAGMGILLLISLFLSGMAVAPAKKAWQQQKQFIADASHELKTPLTVILANNDILLAHGEDKIQAQKKWIESTQEEAVHMKRLVEDMLFLAQADEDAGKKRLLKSRVSVSDLVTGAALQFEPVVFEAGMILETDIEGEILMECDPAQIKQLVHILLDNAVKYSPAGETISLRMKQTAGKLKLTVANGGEPIGEEDLKHLFDRFYRSDQARTGGKGYGLGLSIAKTITEDHGGRIEAASGHLRPDFTGTVITVAFTV